MFCENIYTRSSMRFSPKAVAMLGAPPITSPGDPPMIGSC